jgi:hypothetical protein
MRSPFRREIRDWHVSVESKVEPRLRRNADLLTFGSGLDGGASASTAEPISKPFPPPAKSLIKAPRKA